jgi:hypothetical protein
MKPLLLAFVALLSACNNPTPPPKVEATPKPNPIFETQIQAMKKARAVEGQVNATAEAQRKQIEQAEKP